MWNTLKTETKVLIGILVFSLVMIVGAVVFLSKNTTPSTVTDNTRVYQIDYSKGQKIGSDSAKVKFVEYSDFQCPACKAAEPFVKELIKEKQDLQFIYKHFPLAQHKNADEAAIAAEAAAEQGKFWEMHQALFESQNDWASLANPNEYFQKLAVNLGLDAQKFKESIEQKKGKERVDANLAEGTAVGVNSTPSFYLNGKKLQFANFTELKNLVEAELSK